MPSSITHSFVFRLCRLFSKVLTYSGYAAVFSKRTPRLKTKYLGYKNFFGIITLLLSSTGYSAVIYPTKPFSSYDSYGLSPYWDWNTLESRRFRLIFPKELAAVAQKSADYLEEAHELLSPILEWEPATKTQILVIDNADSANGLSAAFARFGIILWVTPPDSGMSTAFYDDWLRLLVIHEYTHLLNLDTTRSFWKPLRVIFGDLFLPNGAWYPWMLEGLAVYMETRMTRGGRGRSPYYEMMTRAAVEENKLDSASWITLDKLTGNNPYFPGGDTRYQFGYHLMNQIALNRGDPALGALSSQSGERIPFLIDENLENIIGKTWRTLWKEWVEDTRLRQNQNLNKIRSQPVTSYEYLTEPDHGVSNEVLGLAVSPDGQWIAYNNTSADLRPGLYLKNLKTGESKKVRDKLAGVGLKFTPDSKAILYSELNRHGNYYLWSDLGVYSLTDHSSSELTHKLRARDPDISTDGKWVTFTITETAVTGLALAPLQLESGSYKLGPIEKIYMPAMFDRVANPIFSPDQQKIYFSLHHNGKSQEDLMVYDRQTQMTQVLYRDGYYNRYPAVNSQGEIYFVSNLTGVDNLYHYVGPSQSPQLVSNFTSGVIFPRFSPQTPSILYGSVFSTNGWNLARIQLFDHPISPESVKVAPPPAPKALEEKPVRETYSIQSYSAFPSLLPRLWGPLIGIDDSGLGVGAQLMGFDVTNQHRYVLGGAYTTQLQTWDGFALYSNRSFGPDLTLTTSMLTSDISKDTTGYFYSRTSSLTASLGYPLVGTYSTWYPQVGLNFFRYDDLYTLTNSSQAIRTYGSSILSTLDSYLNFSNGETSSLAIATEAGRSFSVASRYYFTVANPIWKVIGSYQENLRLAKHTILTPSVRGSWVSSVWNTDITMASTLQGRTPQQILGAFAGDGLNQFTIRGYPSRSFYPRTATLGALDLRFPLGRIFRGVGVHPFFLDNLYGFAFAENAYLPETAISLPAVGGGLRLSTEIFLVPITLSSEFHYGFRRDLGGANDLFFQLLAPALSF